MSESKGRAWGAAVVAVSLVGLGVAGYLTRLHLDLFYGVGVGESLCDLGGNFSCSTVNASPESEVFGIPQSLLAIPLYVVSAALGAMGLRGRAVGAPLALFGGLAVLYSGYLAWVSATVVGAWCLFCVVLYVVNLALAALGAARAREGGVAAVGGAAVAMALSFGLAWGGYGQVRGGMAAEAASRVVAAPPPVAKEASGEASGGEVKKLRFRSAEAGFSVPKDAPAKGAENAAITIVVLADFQCPYCKRLDGTLKQLVDERPGQVREVFVNYPLNLDCTEATLKKSMHPEACNAAAAATCAEAQGKFWEMHDGLWEHQGELGRDTYRKLAREIGLDAGSFEACLDDAGTIAKIREGTKAGAALGVSGTPTSFVNGREISGPQPIEVFRAVVDAELAGNTAPLDLSIAVGTEETGPVNGPEAVAIAAVPGVSIDTFEASLEGGKAVSRAGVEPARNQAWAEAKSACEAAGKRLCTETEWMAACTGVAPVDADGNGIVSDDPVLGPRYGYADTRHAGACADSRNPDAVGDLKTGDHPRCGSASGAYDLVGGVKEWVGLTPATAALKGGSYSSGESARCGYFRDDIAVDTRDAATGFRCCSGPAHPEPPAVVTGRDVGEKLTPFEVATLDGAKVSSRSFAGKPTIVTFWASWCGPCQKEMPALATLYQKYKAQGLQVLAISVDTDEAKMRTWLAAHTMPFTIGHDPGGKLMETFPNRGLPTTLWIRKDGTVRLRTTGVPPGGERRLEELVTELVGG